MKIIIPSGDGAKLATLSGAQKSKMYRIIQRGWMTPKEAEQNPELMGIIPIIAALATAVPAIATGVGGLISTVSSAKSTQAQNKILAQQIAIESQKAEQLKTALMFGIPAALILVFILTRKK
jgi:hypothetical protein